MRILTLADAKSFWILKSQHLYSRSKVTVVVRKQQQQWRCRWLRWRRSSCFAQKILVWLNWNLTRFSFNGSWINHFHEIRPFCVNYSHNSLVFQIAFIGFSLSLSPPLQPIFCFLSFVKPSVNAWNNFSDFTRCVGSAPNTKINVKQQCTTSISHNFLFLVGRNRNIFALFFM